MEKYEKLLDIYTLEELLERMELEPAELLQLLDDMGYFPPDLVEPL